MANRRERGPFLTVMAVLFGVLAFSNCTKVLQHLQNPTVGGIVLFGTRFASTLGNVTLGPLMGAVLAACSPPHAASVDRQTLPPRFVRGACVASNPRRRVADSVCGCCPRSRNCIPSHGRSKTSTVRPRS